MPPEAVEILDRGAYWLWLFIGYVNTSRSGQGVGKVAKMIAKRYFASFVQSLLQKVIKFVQSVYRMYIYVEKPPKALMQATTTCWLGYIQSSYFHPNPFRSTYAPLISTTKFQEAFNHDYLLDRDLLLRRVLRSEELSLPIEKSARSFGKCHIGVLT